MPKLTSKACLFIPNCDVISQFWGRGLSQSRGRTRKLMPIEERPIMVALLDHLVGKLDSDKKPPRSARCTKLIRSAQVEDWWWDQKTGVGFR